MGTYHTVGCTKTSVSSLRRTIARWRHRCRLAEMQKEMEDSKGAFEVATAGMKELIAELQGRNESLLNELQALKEEVQYGSPCSQCLQEHI